MYNVQSTLHPSCYRRSRESGRNRACLTAFSIDIPHMRTCQGSVAGMLVTRIVIDMVLLMEDVQDWGLEVCSCTGGGGNIVVHFSRWLSRLLSAAFHVGIGTYDLPGYRMYLVLVPFVHVIVVAVLTLACGVGGVGGLMTSWDRTTTHNR